MTELNFTDFDTYLKNQNGRIIHQIWFGTIPNKREARKAYEKLKLYRDSWIIKNPTWRRVEWSKAMCLNLIKTFYPEHSNMFKNYKHEIQRCDAVRYLILHRYGGWYVDMDYYCNRPLDEAMEEYTNDIYFVQSPNGSFLQDDDHISNSLMYSVPNHQFWKQVLIDLEKGQNTPYYYTKHLTVMFTTGPGILNRIYSACKYKYKVKSLPWKLFHPFGIKDDFRSVSCNPSVFAVHMSKGAWSEKDTAVINFVVRDWPILALIIFYFILTIIAYKFL